MRNTVKAIIKFLERAIELFPLAEMMTAYWLLNKNLRFQVQIPENSIKL